MKAYFSPRTCATVLKSLLVSRCFHIIGLPVLLASAETRAVVHARDELQAKAVRAISASVAPEAFQIILLSI